MASIKRFPSAEIFFSLLPTQKMPRWPICVISIRPRSNKMSFRHRILIIDEFSLVFARQQNIQEIPINSLAKACKTFLISYSKHRNEIQNSPRASIQFTDLINKGQGMWHAVYSPPSRFALLTRNSHNLNN